MITLTCLIIPRLKEHYDLNKHHYCIPIITDITIVYPLSQISLPIYPLSQTSLPFTRHHRHNYFVPIITDITTGYPLSCAKESPLDRRWGWFTRTSL